MARAEFTEDELRQAWAHARRHSWPATFEETMADAARSRLVRIAALLMTRGEQIAPQPFNKRPAVVRHRRPLSTAAAALPAHLDRKRAAAGDDE